MKTANLPYSTGNEVKFVNEYGRSMIDGKKTKYREALERIARSDVMEKPIPISEMDNYKTAELERYTVEHEKRETVEQVELISKEQEFADKVRADIARCKTPADYTHLLHKYSELQYKPGFRKDVINHAKNTVIKESLTETDLIDVWNIFKSLAVKEDPEDLLVNALKQRRSEINNKSK